MAPVGNGFVLLGQFAEAFGLLLALKFPIIHSIKKGWVEVAARGIRPGEWRSRRGTAQGVARTRCQRVRRPIKEARPWCHHRALPRFLPPNEERLFQNHKFRHGVRWL